MPEQVFGKEKGVLELIKGDYTGGLGKVIPNQ
jgi:hypothetical protein